MRDDQRESATKKITCRTCERTVVIPEPADGHPYGWFALTAHLPIHLNAQSKRGYRWIGMFCSVRCLMAHEAELLSQQELMRGVYEPE